MNNCTTRYDEGKCWRWNEEMYQTSVDTPWRNLSAWRRLFFGETDYAMRTVEDWWKTRGWLLPTTTEEKLKKNCLIRKKAPAFMHKSTLAKTPLRVTCLARGKPSFLTSSSIHQEKGKHIEMIHFFNIHLCCAGRYSCVLRTLRWGSLANTLIRVTMFQSLMFSIYKFTISVSLLQFFATVHSISYNQNSFKTCCLCTFHYEIFLLVLHV